MGKGKKTHTYFYKLLISDLGKVLISPGLRPLIRGGVVGR